MDSKTCTTFKAIELIGKKWTLPLLQQIELQGSKGFNELMRRMKIVSPKIMTERLKALELQKIIEKKTENKDALRTSYFLTEKGKELQKVLTQFRSWSTKYCDAPEGCTEKNCILCDQYWLSK